MLSVRLDKEFAKGLGTLARVRGSNRSAVVREALIRDQEVVVLGTAVAHQSRIDQRSARAPTLFPFPRDYLFRCRSWSSRPMILSFVLDNLSIFTLCFFRRPSV